ncbi:hypothetical protein KR767_18770 [Luteibacter anthropi]|uniref:hypothetical protein n=1 Tax=Luteibacter anthropi TaxID=564369 RepID=UPI002032402D|nr:hypothetical protein [Luteibacter anthropi]URX62065.1 hypothetical protein KR767_18770 [Luteibacter anthropi]
MENDWRVPVDAEYAALVGRATYVFSYYEWTVIYIIEQLSPGFLTEYSRGGKAMMSGIVLGHMDRAINALSTGIGDVTIEELRAVQAQFATLKDQRNALIHAHPATDVDGSQILIHQKSHPKALPDMKWPLSEVKHLVSAFDKAAVDVSPVLERLMQAKTASE